MNQENFAFSEMQEGDEKIKNWGPKSFDAGGSDKTGERDEISIEFRDGVWLANGKEIKFNELRIVMGIAYSLAFNNDLNFKEVVKKEQKKEKERFIRKLTFKK